MIKLSEELFGDASPIRPGDRFDVEDAHLNGVSGDLGIATASSVHKFIFLREKRWKVDLKAWLYFFGIYASNCVLRRPVSCG